MGDYIHHFTRISPSFIQEFNHAITYSHAQLDTRESSPPNFEHHTKVISSILCHHMDYISGGIGKHGHGIVTPIEPKIGPLKSKLGYLETIAKHKPLFVQ